MWSSRVPSRSRFVLILVNVSVTALPLAFRRARANRDSDLPLSFHLRLALGCPCPVITLMVEASRLCRLVVEGLRQRVWPSQMPTRASSSSAPGLPFRRTTCSCLTSMLVVEALRPCVQPPQMPRTYACAFQRVRDECSGETWRRPHLGRALIFQLPACRLDFPLEAEFLSS